jgi:hypothetical protein
MLHEKPYLMLDVDGVIFPNGSVHIDDPRLDYIPHEPYRTLNFHMSGNIRGTVWEMQVLVTESMIQRVSRLLQHYELVWATMWEERVAKFLPLIPEWPQHADIIPVQHRLSASFKHPGIEAYITERGGTPFAWVDDDHIPPHWLQASGIWESETNGLLSKFTVQDDPADELAFARAHKFIIPDARVGLTDEQVDELIHWANTLD